MTQRDKATAFSDLHVKGQPLVLYNIWDAGSAQAVAAAGAPALATGSWSVAAAQGYGDGQKLPLDQLLSIVERIVATVDLPLSVDFEGAYADDPEQAAANVERLIKAGAIGINFEDQKVGGEGLYGIAEQSARIAAIRQMAEKQNLAFFINARTDLFLKSPPERHKELLPEAMERAHAYMDAGASGFFAPALIDEELIAKLCESSSLPVNIMAMRGAPAKERLATLGVARVSHGPNPFRAMTQWLESEAAAHYPRA